MGPSLPGILLKRVQLWVLPSPSLLMAALVQGGKPLQWVHISLGGTPRVYTCIDQMADLIQKGRDMQSDAMRMNPIRLLSHIDYQILNGFKETMGDEL